MQISTLIKTASASAVVLAGATVFVVSSSQQALAEKTPTIAASSYTAADAAQASITAPRSVISAGTFEGRSDHITIGTARILKTQTGYQLVLGAGFTLDGAPDPVLGFGQDGEYVKVSKFSKLNKKMGEQTYMLPASFTPGEFSEVYVWCEKFDVPLGVATFSAN